MSLLRRLFGAGSREGGREIRADKPYRTRLDYETKRGAEIALVLMDHHIEGLRAVLPLCTSEFRSRMPPELFDRISRQLSKPLADYFRVTNLEPSTKFKVLFAEEIPGEYASSVISSVESLAGENEKWRFLTRKFLRYVLDIHIDLVPFTEQELEIGAR